MPGHYGGKSEMKKKAGGKKSAKGSKEMKDKMAKLRAMKKKK
jgi:hypothetical protein